jgi:hypothetical protein
MVTVVKSPISGPRPSRAPLQHPAQPRSPGAFANPGNTKRRADTDMPAMPTPMPMSAKPAPPMLDPGDPGDANNPIPAAAPTYRPT